MSGNGELTFRLVPINILESYTATHHRLTDLEQAVRDGKLLSPSELATLVELPPSIHLSANRTSTDEAVATLNTLQTLPSYDKCADATGPPSYSSLYNRVRERMQSIVSVASVSAGAREPLFTSVPQTSTAHAQASEAGTNRTLLESFTSSRSSIGYLSLAFVLFLLPLTGTLIGITNVHKCKQEPFIPIFLIVFGIVFAILCFCLFLRSKYKIRHHEQESSLIGMILKGIASFVAFFLGVWFIYGSVMVFRNYNGFYINKKTSDVIECNMAMFVFSFWMSVLVYAVTGISLICYLLIKVCQ